MKNSNMKNFHIIAAILMVFICFSLLGKDMGFATKEFVAGPFPTKKAAMKGYKGKLPDRLEVLGTGKWSLEKGFFVVKRVKNPHCFVA